MSKKKIALVSATRAEWYLLWNLAKELEKDEKCELLLLVTGAHLSENFGYTFKEIEKDFTITKKIPILQDNDGSLSLAKSLAVAVSAFAEAFETLKPDAVVILGDRYEMLGVASAALMMHIPIIHLCGGELTLGAMDDSIRHSISKMASLHFVSTKAYKKRLMQLGEEEGRIFNVGSLAGENVKKLKLLSKKELESELGLSLKNFLLITYHSETLNLQNTKKEVQILLDFLDTLKDITLIFTKANADENGLLINQALENYCLKNSHKAKLFDNLGALKYLSALKHAKAVVGNSSSGICESGFFKTPCINIGDRQKGRIRGDNIIDCKMKDLKKAFKRLESKEFKEKMKHFKNPFESKKSPSIFIKDVIKNTNLATILQKDFVDRK
ncbi:UDP-N-acetylglucosamine 2-epimerase [Campylobacter helveticus]|uniref:UDP-N-acetylglucosamine 2-epimerase (Hydrolyzing) n=1 Tax=Campylobacter helveticus TaxID=28898 RepID=A0AAX2UN15_9BACT|nr:UDP-N-acetylglucosamine 2-epimerase [Campylobacter helveticus]ARE81219.1 GDP-2,4-diacetamido-2,4,6-trideoxy-alpha-D-glucopyranose hydrolase / 2-epimerase [Campylobacter helveticus]MCR2054746.1 UDP-N-acetylglucosamine 2-epimerase [Campylobacter helveticus]TNB57787.1 UDP-N-acetylglucosamine 2-epimerase (hydrolyzing) [Campylobacter helveticus]TNB59095.1 UDP-N-acetylglucosamine 2-epimerase (hydrolyzing) [Campylobacter helveticus]TNB60301.1 UDP-N-acetylglucosamine 2-epimerase (hydrolyzing) [Camp